MVFRTVICFILIYTAWSWGVNALKCEITRWKALPIKHTDKLYFHFSISLRGRSDTGRAFLYFFQTNNPICEIRSAPVDCE